MIPFSVALNDRYFVCFQLKDTTKKQNAFEDERLANRTVGRRLWRNVWYDDVSGVCK